MSGHLRRLRRVALLVTPLPVSSVCHRRGAEHARWRWRHSERRHGAHLPLPGLLVPDLYLLLHTGTRGAGVGVEVKRRGTNLQLIQAQRVTNFGTSLART